MFIKRYLSKLQGAGLTSPDRYMTHALPQRRLPDFEIYIHKCMMTSSNGNIFRVTGPLCGEFTGPGEFPPQRPLTRSFDVFFDLRLNKRLSKQPWGWWFETPSWSLWRYCDDFHCLGLEENGRHFAIFTFNCIVLNESWCIVIRHSLNFISNGQIVAKSNAVH